MVTILKEGCPNLLCQRWKKRLSIAFIYAKTLLNPQLIISIEESESLPKKIKIEWDLENYQQTFGHKRKQDHYPF